MANLFNEKLKSVYKLLKERNMSIINDISDDLRCVICKQIPTDTHSTGCGCRFCKECVDNYKNKGGICCPGNTEDCQYDNLSNIVIDHNANRQISRLIVICGHENCGFSCELMNMESHMETCLKKTNCPFEIVGCEEKLSEDEMNEHLRLENLNHTKLLMEMIKNFKNEMNELRENDKVNKWENKLLKENAELQKNEMKILKENCDSMKMEMEKWKDEELEVRSNQKFELIHENIKSMQIDIENLIGEMKEQMNTNLMHNEIRKVEIENMENKEDRNMEYGRLIESAMTNCDELNSINEEIVLNKVEMETLKNQMTEANKDMEFIKLKIEKVTTEKIEKSNANELEMKRRINLLEKYLDIRDGIFVWNIGRIDKLDIGRHYSSEYFYNRSNPYKIGLWLRRSHETLSLWLNIFSGGLDDHLDWPFKANVTIKIAIKGDEMEQKSIMKKCIINRPINNQCKLSERFTFNKVDLRNINLSLNNIIECVIDYNTLID